MPTRSKSILGWTCIALSIVLFLWIGSFAPSFQQCAAEHTNRNGYNETEDFQRELSVRVVNYTSRFLRCEAVFANENIGFLTAIATITIAIFTLTLKRATDRLWAAGKEQSRLTQQSIDLGRQEFISTHRPKIILREAIIATLAEGQPISVMIHLANVGNTRGTIIRSTVRVEIVSVERLLMHDSVELKNDLETIELNAGADRLCKVPGEMPKWDAHRFSTKSNITISGAITRRDSTIHLVGQIIYVDGIGIPRRTAFRRELNPDRRRFYRIEDEPDLDYAD